MNKEYYYTTHMTEVGGKDIKNDAPIFKANSLQDMLQEFVLTFWSTDDRKPLSKKELKAMTQQELREDHDYKYLVVETQAFSDDYWKLADDTRQYLWCKTACGEDITVLFHQNEINQLSKYIVLPEVGVFGYTFEKDLINYENKYINWRDKENQIYVFSLEEGEWL